MKLYLLSNKFLLSIAFAVTLGIGACSDRGSDGDENAVTEQAADAVDAAADAANEAMDEAADEAADAADEAMDEAADAVEDAVEDAVDAAVEKDLGGGDD